MPEAPEEFIPLTEAAIQLGISWDRARRLMCTGRLSARKDGGRWTVSVSSVRRVAGELDTAPSAA